MNSTTLAGLMKLFTQHGPDAVAHAFTTLFNGATRIVAEHVLNAAPRQRTDERRGYANSCKPKTLDTRAGPVELRIGTPFHNDYSPRAREWLRFSQPATFFLAKISGGHTILLSDKYLSVVVLDSSDERPVNIW